MSFEKYLKPKNYMRYLNQSIDKNTLARRKIVGIVKNISKPSSEIEINEIFNCIRDLCRSSNEDQLIAGARNFFSIHRLDYALVLCSDSLRFGNDTQYHVAQAIVDYLSKDNFTITDIQKIVLFLQSREDINVVDLYKHVINVAAGLKDFDFRSLLPILDRVSGDDLINIANQCLGLGIATPASLMYQHVAKSRHSDMLLRNQIANTEFLRGQYEEARKHWVLLSHQRSVVRSKFDGLDDRIRFLGDTWMMAIGHLATLATFVQGMRLGLYGDIRPILVYDRRKSPPNMEIIRLLSKVIEIHEIDGDVLEYKWRLISRGAQFDYDRAVEVVIGYTEDFWYAPDMEGSVSWYGPAGAAIDKSAREKGFPPVISYAPDEIRARRVMLEHLYGLPREAWFVGLHVREPGFHKGWHTSMPGTRNADIATYVSAVDAIIEAGGYVVRLGDPSMTPFKPRPEVIDYATANIRQPDLDVFLCAESRFVIGTNSGYSLVPSMFGVRCLLTNWSPIGTPNWITNDLMVPKRIWNRAEQRYLTLEEMYRSFSGWSQFLRDFEETQLEIRDNTPDEITAAVQEMLAETSPGHSERRLQGTTARTTARSGVEFRRMFTEIVEQNGGYVGSMISLAFAERHPELFERLPVSGAGGADEDAPDRRTGIAKSAAMDGNVVHLAPLDGGAGLDDGPKAAAQPSSWRRRGAKRALLGALKGDAPRDPPRFSKASGDASRSRSSDPAEL